MLYCRMSVLWYIKDRVALGNGTWEVHYDDIHSNASYSAAFLRMFEGNASRYVTYIAGEWKKWYHPRSLLYKHILAKTASKLACGLVITCQKFTGNVQVASCLLLENRIAVFFSINETRNAWNPNAKLIHYFPDFFCFNFLFFVLSFSVCTCLISPVSIK